MPDTLPDILIAAAALMRADGSTLLVRKRGASAFMQPGGKIDQGETPLAALCRELVEELNLTLPPDAFRPLGRFSAPAANEPGHRVVAELFLATIDAEVTPQAEIAEIRWINPAQTAALDLAPLTRDLVLPLLGMP